MSGIGINLRKVPDDNGDVKLKVLGLVLDGPAHSAGVRQVFISIEAKLTVIDVILCLFLYISLSTLDFHLLLVLRVDV